MFALFDTFNNRVISRHRTIETLVEAEKKFHRQFAKNNTPNSYLPTAARKIVDGELEPIDNQTLEYMQYLSIK